MLNYLTHKLKNQQISEDNMVNHKIDERDSGTESDGNSDHEDKLTSTFKFDKELTMSSNLIAVSPTIFCQKTETSHLLYDQHSSEEELEVINGSSSLPSTVALKQILSVRGTNDSAASESSSAEPEMFEESPKRASSTQSETRKRSLPHNSDDEVRNLLDLMPAPLNFRASPPLEAIRKIDFRVCGINPMSLLETSKGIENIKISCDSNNLTGDILSSEDDDVGCNNSSKRSSSSSNNGGKNYDDTNIINSVAVAGGGGGVGGATVGTTTTSSFCLTGGGGGGAVGGEKSICINNSSNNNSNINNGNQSQQHQQQKFNENQFYSHFSSTSSSSLNDVRSISPPAKVSRRPPRTHQRLHRPHRPCLDFDKMQQIKTRSVGSWRQNEKSGDVSIFCW